VLEPLRDLPLASGIVGPAEPLVDRSQAPSGIGGRRFELSRPGKRSGSRVQSAQLEQRLPADDVGAGEIVAPLEQGPNRGQGGGRLTAADFHAGLDDPCRRVVGVGGQCQVVTSGLVGGFAGLTIGGRYILGTAVGAIVLSTDTGDGDYPSSAGEVVMGLGYARTADTLYVNPRDFTTI